MAQVRARLFGLVVIENEHFEHVVLQVAIEIDVHVNGVGAMIVEFGIIRGGYDLGVVIVEIEELVDTIGRGLSTWLRASATIQTSDFRTTQYVYIQLVHVVNRSSLGARFSLALVDRLMKQKITLKVFMN